MSIHPASLKIKVRNFRRKGHSIGDIVSKFSIPKTTAWHYIRGITLTEKQHQLLRSKQGGSKLRSEREWMRAREEAKSIFQSVDETKILPAVLASLYWSEGTKDGGFIFTNTDPRMIQAILSVLRKLFRITSSRVRLLVRTCTPMNPKECLYYWHRVTNIPLSNIKINHDDTQNKSKTQFGICRLTVKKSGYILKVTDCLIEELIVRMNTLSMRSRSSRDRTSHS